jgi:hypothetical protein
MRKPCSILVFSVLLSLGLSVFVPAEDVPETAYDESETLPLASTPMFSIPVPNAVVPAPAGRSLVAASCPGSLRRLGSQRLDHWTVSPYAISNSLTSLARILRC